MAVTVPLEGTETWPRRMRTSHAARYLTDVHGIPVVEKTLRNWRASGTRGPVCRYLGTLPLYDLSELDRWAEEDALQAESPTRRTRRLAREAAQQVAEKSPHASTIPAFLSGDFNAVGSDAGPPHPQHRQAEPANWVAHGGNGDG